MAVDPLRWHNDGRPVRPKRQPCSIQPCDACVEDGIVPGPIKVVNEAALEKLNRDPGWALDYYRTKVEDAVKANQGSIGNTTDAIMEFITVEFIANIKGI